MYKAVGSVVFNQHLLKTAGIAARLLHTSTCCKAYQEEPDYLKYLKPQVPVHELVNIQIKGYDFTVVEHYAKHVHKVAVNMNIDVENAWASPHQAFRVTNTEPNSTKVANEYNLNVYERNIQIMNLAAYSAPSFFEVIQSVMPAGIMVSIHPHEPHHEEYRYIPDFELIELKRQLLEVEATLDENKAEELVAIQKAEKEAARLRTKPEKKT